MSFYLRMAGPNLFGSLILLSTPLLKVEVHIWFTKFLLNCDLCAGETITVVGDHNPALLKYFDCTRSGPRSAFDSNVVYQFEIMEYVRLIYLFLTNQSLVAPFSLHIYCICFCLKNLKCISLCKNFIAAQHFISDIQKHPPWYLIADFLLLKISPTPPISWSNHVMYYYSTIWCLTNNASLA